MSRSRRGDNLHGVVLIDKPVGCSAQSVVSRVKYALQVQKAGHTGTLDPFAQGLMIVCLGAATRLSQALLDADKRYEAQVCLGVETTTGDTEGVALSHDQPAAIEAQLARLEDAQIETVLEAFRGEIEQVPPMYSALKHQGRALYQYARAGLTVPLAPRTVCIKTLTLRKLQAYDPSTCTRQLRLEVECSKGTYIRSLAQDIGRALGCGAHLNQLRRTTIGSFSVDAAVSLSRLIEAAHEDLAVARTRYVQPADSLIDALPAVVLSESEQAAFRQGMAPVTQMPPARYRVYSADGAWMGIACVRDDRLQPAHVVTGQAAGGSASALPVKM